MSIKHEERPAAWLSGGFIFCVLCGHYVLRALRDEIGAANIRDLQWFWTGTFIAMLLAVPVYSALVARFPRRTFIAMTYRFFMVCLLVFFVALKVVPLESDARVWAEGAFYVWQAVFSLFAVMVFWSMMADLWTSEQGKRLFGPIAVGGTIGGIVGSFLTQLLLAPPQWMAFAKIDANLLLLLPIVFLEVAVRLAGRLDRCQSTAPAELAADDAPAIKEQMVAGGMLDGMFAVFKSPYLLAICGFLFLHTLTGTFLYFEQSEIVSDVITSRDDRRVLFARMDLVVNALALIGQAFLARWVMTRFSVALTLVILPVVVGIGFIALAIGVFAEEHLAYSPVLAAVIVFQVIRRSSNYALARPAREVLYTVVPRRDKYKSKSFIDTAVYRGGDLLSAWMFAGMRSLGLGLGAIALTAVPLAAVWAVLGWRLGRKQQDLAEAHTGAGSDVVDPGS